MTGPTLDAPKVHSLGRWSIVLVLVMVGVSGCAYQPLSIPPPDAPGFWLGVWHGFIVPIRLVGSFFADHRLQELDAAKFLTVTVNLYHEQEKEPQDITKGEWKVILEHLGASPEEIKDVQVKMGKWR